MLLLPMLLLPMLLLPMLLLPRWGSYVLVRELFAGAHLLETD